jgi:hypothetical protein
MKWHCHPYLNRQQGMFVSECYGSWICCSVFTDEVVKEVHMRCCFSIFLEELMKTMNDVS